MKITRISAYDIEEGTSNTLDTNLYSKFKYGHRPTSTVFATKMFQSFLEMFGKNWLIEHANELIISTSPYWYTPPAAHSLVAYFHYLINELFVEENITPIRYVKIHRSSPPVCDFSKLNSEERQKNMKRDSLSVDPEAFKGKTLIIVEDSRITGAHEEKIAAFAENLGVTHVIFVYVVIIKDGESNPDIENRINHIAITDLTILYHLMNNAEDFAFNSRVCRFLLSWENTQELTEFFNYLSDQLLYTVYVSSINDGYALVDEFKPGFQILKKEFDSRAHLDIYTEEIPIISMANSQH